MLIASLLTLSLLPTAMADQPILIPILPPAGFTSLWPQAVSADGSTVVGITTNQDSSIVRAFRWRRASGVVELLSTLNGSKSRAYAVSRSGDTVVGEQLVSGRTTAITWDQSGIRGELPGLGRAYCITPNGSVIGGSTTQGRPALYSGGQVRVLQSQVFASVLALTPDGRVAVGESGFIWDEVNGFRQLLDSRFPGSKPLCINDDGRIIGGYYDEIPNRSLKAFLWRDGRAERYLPEFSAQEVRTLSGDGFLVLGSPSATATSFIVVGSSGPLSLTTHLRNLGTIGVDEWSALLANAINPSGTALTGPGLNRDGAIVGWLVVGNLRGNHLGARTSPTTRAVDPE